MTKTSRKAQDDRMATIRKQNAEVIAKGVCPDCGTKLRRNLALADWWQCGAFGEPDFRPAEFRNLPKCNFQI